MNDIVLALEFLGAAIVSIIVISNPISTSTVFLTLTDGWNRSEKERTAKKASLYALYILLFFSITGLFIFALFGFSVGAFRIAGGIILFTFAISMVFPKPQEAAERYPREIALIPIAIPFISGPGTIVTVVLLMSDASEFLDPGALAPGLITITGVYLGIAITIYVSYQMMIRSDFVYDRLKEEGRIVLTKMLGLIVMAIAVQFVINGIMDIIPQFLAIQG